MLRVGSEFGNEFRERSNGRLAGEYLRLDLAAIARGMGAASFSADSAATLREALLAARRHPGPAVIVASVVPHADLPPGGVWWDVAPAETAEATVTRDLRADYERDRERLQRFFG
jgi:3D-(3,5/4)-trihydroxycyclohexane-1,2-dione acylhydrolase (decyclizing)